MARHGQLGGAQQSVPSRQQPGVAAVARYGAFSVLQDMGFDVLREFWPEVARKLKMPFRGVREE